MVRDIHRIGLLLFKQFINCYILGHVVFVTTTVFSRRTLTDVYIPCPPFECFETSSLTDIACCAVSMDERVSSSSSTTSWPTETGSVNNNTPLLETYV